MCLLQLKPPENISHNICLGDSCGCLCLWLSPALLWACSLLPWQTLLWNHSSPGLIRQSLGIMENLVLKELLAHPPSNINSLAGWQPEEDKGWEQRELLEIESLLSFVLKGWSFPLGRKAFPHCNPCGTGKALAANREWAEPQTEDEAGGQRHPWGPWGPPECPGILKTAFLRVKTWLVVGFTLLASCSVWCVWNSSECPCLCFCHAGGWPQMFPLGLFAALQWKEAGQECLKCYSSF